VGLLDALRSQAGVTALASEGAALDIGLTDNADAVPLLGWLQGQGHRPVHFATARASLEDIFLDLTGRTLRD
jgi:ABC-2 type transport system ATP-binding protein